MRALLMFVAGLFVASAFVVPSSAQSMPAANLAYVKQVTEQIATLDDYYAAMNGFYFSTSTSDEIVKANRLHTELKATLAEQTPPIALLALHTQLQFTVVRCENMAAGPKAMKDPKNITELSLLGFVPIRESCATQIHNTRLRLIDYAAGYGINPFE